MGKTSVCVFCGNKLTPYRYNYVYCGSVPQLVCKSCEKEVSSLDDAEVCRRALAGGRADQPDKVRAHMEVAEHAEEHRFTCLRCGSRMRFGQIMSLDTSPMRDSIFSKSFDTLPVHCDNCGKIEFFDPIRLSKDEHIAYLIVKDAKKDES